MLNVGAAIALAQENSQSVTATDTVLEQHRLEHLRIGSRGEQRTIHQADVPKGQVVRRHGELSGCKHPARTFLGRWALGTEGVALIAGGIRGRQPGGIRVVDVVHAQRQEDTFLQQVDQRNAAYLLDDSTRNDKVGVGILPLRAGVEIQGSFSPYIQDVLRGCGNHHGGHHVVFRPVILIAGSVR